MSMPAPPQSLLPPPELSTYPLKLPAYRDTTRRYHPYPRVKRRLDRIGLSSLVDHGLDMNELEYQPQALLPLRPIQVDVGGLEDGDVSSLDLDGCSTEDDEKQKNMRKFTWFVINLAFAFQRRVQAVRQAKAQALMQKTVPLK